MHIVIAQFKKDQLSPSFNSGELRRDVQRKTPLQSVCCLPFNISWKHVETSCLYICSIMMCVFFILFYVIVN